MILADLSSRFEAFSREQKINLLAAMILALTVEARSATIDLSPDRAAYAYKGLNEIQHSVANQLNAFLRPNGNIRPSLIFWDGLQELARHFHLEDNLRSAVEWAFSRR